jgi:hypothetical protein
MAGYSLLNHLYYQTDFQNGTTTFNITMLNIKTPSIIGFLWHIALMTFSIITLSIKGSREY